MSRTPPPTPSASASDSPTLKRLHEYWSRSSWDEEEEAIMLVHSIMLRNLSLADAPPSVKKQRIAAVANAVALRQAASNGGRVIDFSDWKEYDEEHYDADDDEDSDDDDEDDDDDDDDYSDYMADYPYECDGPYETKAFWRRQEEEEEARRT